MKQESFLYPYRKILLSASLLIGILLIGILGYSLLEDMNFLDALYMTVITVATVGYKEVKTLSDEGKIFTIFLIITSFGIFAYAISSITQFIIEGEFNQFFKNKKKVDEIAKLHNHVIICGFGRNGKQAAQVLKHHHQQFVVIEKDSSITDNITHKYKHLVLTGDATNDEILIKAGIQRAKALITTLPNDADNLFIVLSARHLNPHLYIISRASKENSDTKLKIAGADKVIMPDKVGGAHMGTLVLKPDTVELIEMISSQGLNDVFLEEILYNELSASLHNKTLKELELRHKCGANIIGFKTPEGQYIINPSPDTPIIPNSKIFVLGTKEQIKKLKHLLSENT
ncbi:MAG: potassium channel protein [Bacteroidetes bacterium]|jgi:voltage-gated potassium channel|nr:MAG: potassium channel protein [Bacteroidota bacterium]